MMRRRLVTGTAWLTLGMVISQSASMLVYALTARSDTPANYGQLTATIAWVTVASGVAVWGSNLVASRNVATGTFSISGFRDWLRSRMLVFSLGSLVILPAGSVVLHSLVAGVGLAAFFALINGTSAVGSWFLGREDYRTLFAASAFSRVVLLIVTALLVMADRLTATLLPVLLAGVLLLETLWLYANLPKDEGRRRYVNPWRGTLTVGAATSASGLQQLDTPLVAAVAGAGQAGFYSAVLRWTNPMTLVSTAFAGASLSQIAAAKSRRTLLEVYVIGLRLLPVPLIGLVALWVLAGPLVEFILGSAYSESALVLRILLVGTIPRMMYEPLFVTLQTRGDERWALMSVLIYTSTLLLGVGAGAFMAGAVGAAVGWAFGQLVFLVVLSICVFTRMPAMPDQEEVA